MRGWLKEAHLVVCTLCCACALKMSTVLVFSSVSSHYTEHAKSNSDQHLVVIKKIDEPTAINILLIR